MFGIWNIRWPTTVTSKPNAHSKLQSAHIKFKSLTSNSNGSHQIQMAHSKFKSLTANSNHSQQIQITHSKLQITHSKLQIAHSKLQIAHIKFKSPTANSNRSQQIKVAHSKFKLLTANYKLSTPLGVFGYLKQAVQLFQKYLSYMKPLPSKVCMCKPTRLLRFADGLCYDFFLHRGVSIPH